MVICYSSLNIKLVRFLRWVLVKAGVLATEEGLAKEAELFPATLASNSSSSDLTSYSG